MSKTDVNLILLGSLAVADISGAQTKEIIQQYRSIGIIQQLPALESEQGVISIGALSKKMQAPVKIVWMNQMRYLSFITPCNDDILIRRYIETVIRRTFNTPDEMKLASPLQPRQ